MMVTASVATAAVVTTSVMVDAPAAVAYRLFADVEAWPRIFPKVEAVRRVTADDSRIEVLVRHATEGNVPNVLILRPPDTIVLEEAKRHYRAVFVNRFHTVGERSRYEVTATIRLTGWRRLLSSVLGPYVRGQLLALTLRPLKAAAEASTRSLA